MIDAVFDVSLPIFVAKRYRKVIASCRVTFWFGENVVEEVPLVIPLLDAYITAFA